MSQIRTDERGGFVVISPRSSAVYDPDYLAEAGDINNWMVEQFDPLEVTWRISPVTSPDGSERFDGYYWKAELSDYNAAVAFLLRWN